jgi:hypothetical protein
MEVKKEAIIEIACMEEGEEEKKEEKEEKEKEKEEKEEKKEEKEEEQRLLVKDMDLLMVLNTEIFDIWVAVK